MTKDTQTSVTPATDEMIAEYEYTASRYVSDDIEWTTADIHSLIARIRASETRISELENSPEFIGWIVNDYAGGWFLTQSYHRIASYKEQGCDIKEVYTHPTPPKPLSYEGEQS